jgi:hypothetical protein
MCVTTIPGLYKIIAVTHHNFKCLRTSWHSEGSLEKTEFWNAFYQFFSESLILWLKCTEL